MAQIKKYVWVKGLQVKLNYYQARNVVQKQEIRRLKQLLRDRGQYYSFISSIKILFNKLKLMIWKK